MTNSVAPQRHWPRVSAMPEDHSLKWERIFFFLGLGNLIRLITACYEKAEKVIPLLNPLYYIYSKSTPQRTGAFLTFMSGRVSLTVRAMG